MYLRLVCRLTVALLALAAFTPDLGAFAWQATRPAPTPVGGPVRVSPDLASKLASLDGAATIPVIIRGDDVGRLLQAIRAVVGPDSIAAAKQLGVVKSVALDLAPEVIERLRETPGVRAITLDRPVAGSALENYDQNHLRATTGASQVVGTAGFSPMNGQFNSYLSSMSATGVN